MRLCRRSPVLHNAVREAEKALRQDAIPLRVQLEKKMERKTKRRSLTRDSVMEHSAKVGFLAWKRSKLPAHLTPDRSAARLTFHFTPVAASATDTLKRETAQKFIADLESTRGSTVSTWTDGTLQRAPQNMYRSLHGNERVAVNWDDGWYTGVYHCYAVCRNGQSRHSQFDGDLINYTSRTSQRDRALHCKDEDRDTLTLYRSISHFLGGARIVIQCNVLLTKLSRPAGAVGSSFDNEVIAAIEAFRLLLSDSPSSGTLIRW